MAAVLRTVLASPLARSHPLDVIPTWRPGSRRERALLFLGALARFAVWCVGRGPRVAHIHATVRGSMYRKAVCVLVGKALRRPVIVHVHSGEGDLRTFHERTGRVRRALLRWAFLRADRVVAVSEPTAARLAENFPGLDVTVVRSPLPFAAPNGRSRAGGAVRILYLGGFANPVKGGTVLLEALQHVLAAGANVEVTVAGPGAPPSGALDDGRVHFAGWLDEVRKAELFDDSDVFVLPSLSEGLPVALLEAMAHGKAIVATRVGGVPDVVDDGTEALLVPPNDAEALASRLIELAEDAQRRHTLSVSARIRAETLDDGAFVAHFEALYRDLARA